MPKVARVIYNRLEAHRDRRSASSRSTRRSTTPSTGTSASRSTTEDLADRLAVQHLPQPRAAARRRSRRPATRRSQAAANPADGDWLLLRDGQPAAPARPSSPTTYDEFLQFKDELREYCDRPRRPAEWTRCAVRGARRPDRSLAVAGPAPGRLRRDSAWTGSTTRTGSPRAGWRRSWPGWTASWRGLSLTMPLKREALAAASTPSPTGPRSRARPTRWCSAPDGAARRQHRPAGRDRRRSGSATTDPLDRHRDLGGGATAASVLLAARRAGLPRRARCWCATRAGRPRRWPRPTGTRDRSRCGSVPLGDAGRGRRARLDDPRRSRRAGLVGGCAEVPVRLRRASTTRGRRRWRRRRRRPGRAGRRPGPAGPPGRPAVRAVHRTPGAARRDARCWPGCPGGRGP